MQYRLLFHEAGHRRLRRFEFDAPDDAEAEGAVLDLSDAVPQELWCGKRRVRIWSWRELADDTKVVLH